MNRETGQLLPDADLRIWTVDEKGLAGADQARLKQMQVVVPQGVRPSRETREKSFRAHLSSALGSAGRKAGHANGRCAWLLPHEELGGSLATGKDLGH